MQMIPFHERVVSVFSALQTTPHKFATLYGFNRVSMYNMVNPERKPGVDMLERVCVAEPRISAEYLLRGEGEPLRDQRLATNLTTVEQLLEFKTEINQSLDKRIQELGG